MIIISYLFHTLGNFLEKRRKGKIADVYVEVIETNDAADFKENQTPINYNLR